MKRLRSDRMFFFACLLASSRRIPDLGCGFGRQLQLETLLTVRTYLTPADNQRGWGYCWAFSMVGALEAKYKLTRNDPTFDIDLSEQNLICDCNQGGSR